MNNKNNDLAIVVLLVSLAILGWLSLRPTPTNLIQVPDTSTDEWLVKGFRIANPSNLDVERGQERRSVKLCGIRSAPESIEAIKQLINNSGGRVKIAFLRQENRTWVGEVWVNAAEEGEKLLNELLILAGAAVVDRTEWQKLTVPKSLGQA